MTRSVLRRSVATIAFATCVALPASTPGLAQAASAPDRAVASTTVASTTVATTTASESAGKVPSWVPPSERARTQCVRGSGPSAGRCFTYKSSIRRSVRVEAVPIRNQTSRRGTFTCTFTKEITKTLEAGVSLSASAKGSVFKVVEAGVEATVSLKLSQTARQATSVAGTFQLNPGQRVVCYRTYGTVVAKVKDVEYRGTKRYVNTRTVRVPSYLGATYTD